MRKGLAAALILVGLWLASALVAGVYFLAVGGHHASRAVIAVAVVFAVGLLFLVAMTLRRVLRG